MKTILGNALRSSFGAKVFPVLIGIPPSSRAKFAAAAQTPAIIPVVGFLIRLRLLRLIKKVASTLASGACRILPGARNPDTDSACDGQAPSDVALSAEGDQGQPLRLPPAFQGRAFPKVIFQTWKSKVLIPLNYARWSESFRRMNPDFEYFIWDDFDNRRFIEKYYAWFLPIYDAYPREIYRADAVRYFFLYHFGGLYVDMDTECLSPVMPLFQSGDVWLGRMGSDPEFPHSIPNAIMASRPRQDFWLLVIHFLIENASGLGEPGEMAARGPEAITGPIVLKRAHDTYVYTERDNVKSMIRDIAARLPDNLQPQAHVSEIVLFAPDIWYPIDWSNVIYFRLLSEISDSKLMLGERLKRRLFPESFLVTYWTHSWKKPAR